MQLRTFSFGGGVQSTAALVLAAQGKIDFPVFLFSNVGDDSELPETLQYVRDIAMPYAASSGIAIHELQRVRRNGATETLYSQVVGDNRSVDIPMYMSQSGALGNRSCTEDFKIRVINKWLKGHGATVALPAICGLGISIDEFKRMRSDDPRFPYIRKDYPLIDLRLTRQDCMNIITHAGLPVPPKSSCWFCPFHRVTEWQRLKRDTPLLFDRAVALEQRVNEKRASFGRDPIWLTDKLRPIDTVVGDQSDMFDETEENCESGFCMT